jgi:hypothetical protein
MDPQENNKKTVVLQDEGLRKLKGFVQIPKFVLLCKSLSYGAKVAYGILLGYAWQDEFCFPAQKSLANDLGCSVRQAQRFLDELKKEEFITWKQVGFNRPNVYYILSLPSQKSSASQNHYKVDGGGNALKNKDTTNMSYPDRTDMSTPDTTNMSGQEATPMSTYKYSDTNNQNNVNVEKEGKARGDESSPTSDVAQNTTSEVQKTPHQRWPESPHQTWRSEPHNNINNVNVNADKEKGEIAAENKTDLRSLPDIDQPKEKTKYLTEQIATELGDQHSQAFYYLVAAKVPESVIRQALAEIKQGGARSPARVFTSRMKAYAAERIDTRTTSLHSAMQAMQKNMTLH